MRSYASVILAGRHMLKLYQNESYRRTPLPDISITRIEFLPRDAL